MLKDVKWLVGALWLVVGSALLTGCGNRGALYLPPDETSSRLVERSNDNDSEIDIVQFKRTDAQTTGGILGD